MGLLVKSIEKQKHGGAWPVLVTPYDEDLKIDVSAYRTMLDWYLQFDIGGLYANCGQPDNRASGPIASLEHRQRPALPDRL